MRVSVAHLIACLCLGSSSALADCAKIAQAMIAVEEAPGVRQKLFAGKAAGDAMQLESLKLEDAMYLRQGDGGTWRRVPFNAAQRREKSEKMLKALPLSDCAGPRAAADGAVPVQVFDYSQPDPLKGGAKSRSSIWLGADGRIRRLLLEDGSYQTFEYGAFEAPVAEAPRRAKAN
jgi:hypothetical protein